MPINERIAEELLTWYKRCKRELPWRGTSDPYLIWISEILLQQTRVAQGLPYFERFVSRYPNVHELARAPENEVLKLWQGLGYYSRAHNMHETAKRVHKENNGVFPKSYAELIKLKGIGAYTAAAISSIAHGERVPVVDGNVFRVVSRLVGVESPINESGAHKLFSGIASELMGLSSPGDFNQAIMELGAMVCTPKKPNCENCPISDSCYAFKHSKQDSFPVKLAKKAKKNRFMTYILLQDNDKFLLRKRGMNDIWKGMFEPLLIEGSALLNPDETYEHVVKKTAIDQLKLYGETLHLLTHRNLYLRFYVAQVKGQIIQDEEDIWINRSELTYFALPKPISIFVEKIAGDR